MVDDEAAQKHFRRGLDTPLYVLILHTNLCFLFFLRLFPQVRSWAWWRICSPAWARPALLPGRGLETILTLCNILWSSSAWNPTVSISKSASWRLPGDFKWFVSTVYFFTICINTARKLCFVSGGFCVNSRFLCRSVKSGNFLVIHRSEYA